MSAQQTVGTGSADASFVTVLSCESGESIDPASITAIAHPADTTLPAYPVDAEVTDPNVNGDGRTAEVTVTYTGDVVVRYVALSAACVQAA